MKIKEIDSLLAELTKQGWKVTKGRKHIKALPPDKTQSAVIIAGTPSDHRAIKNIVSRCRNRGASL